MEEFLRNINEDTRKKHERKCPRDKSQRTVYCESDPIWKLLRVRQERMWGNTWETDRWGGSTTTENGNSSRHNKCTDVLVTMCVCVHIREDMLC
jgi:hypothetical protein